MHFEIDPQPLAEELTALGGVPLVVRAFRSLGLPAAIAYIPKESVELRWLAACFSRSRSYASFRQRPFGKGV